MKFLSALAAKWDNVGAPSTPRSIPPQILREEMAFDSDYRMDGELIDDAHALWIGLRESFGRTPDWSAFKPFDHPAMLPQVMLYSRIDGRFHCSLIGEGARQFLPIKMVGRFIDEVMPPANVADMNRRFNTALDTGKPNFVEKTMAWNPGSDFVTYSALQLPFAGQDSKPNRILCVMSFRVERAFS